MAPIRIIGAGIGGLAAAIALRRAGFEALVFERAPQFSPIGAGIVLAPNAIHLLSQWGVDVRSAGARIATARVRDVRGRTIQTSDLRHALGDALAFDRADLHKVLLDALPPEAVHLGHSYSPNDPALDDEILIGADGIRSAVRQNLVGSVPLRYSGCTCWRGICSNPGITEMQEDWGGVARIGIVPLTRDRIYVFLVKTAAPGLARQTSLAAIRDSFAAFSSPVPAALDALGRTNLLHHDLEEMEKPVWGAGRTILIGDAAHAMTPNLGQGAGMAIEDAAVLPAVIVTVNPAAELAKLRHARVLQIQRTSRWLGKLAHWESTLACGLRDAGLRAIPQSIADRSYAQMIEAGIELTREG